MSSKETIGEPLDAFFDYSSTVDTSPLRVVDRSTLERYATCPAQAVLLDSGELLNESDMANAGEEVHAAFGRAISEYKDSGGHMTKRDLQASIEQHLFGARPDVQPEAIKAARASLWDWCELIAGQHEVNIIRYDGGDLLHSGQLAWDLPDLGLRCTSEVDLLLATASPEIMHEYDYKSGFANYIEGDVRDSFQFQFHAWLCFLNYEELKGLRVTVWMTRTNRRTYTVEFHREELPKLTARIRSAAEMYLRYKGDARAPAWPSVDKCPTCPAAIRCPASLHVSEIGADPHAFVDAMHATQLKLDAMAELAKKYVDTHGDIVTAKGFAFGRSKPKAERKANATLYTLKGDNE